MIRKAPTSCALKSIRVLVACDNRYDSFDHSTQQKSSAQKDSSARTQIRGVFRAKMVNNNSIEHVLLSFKPMTHLKQVTQHLIGLL